MKIEGIHIVNLQSYAALQGIMLPSPNISIESEKYYPAEWYLKELKELDQQASMEDLGYALGQHLKLQSLGLIYQISLLATGIQEAFTYLNEYLMQSFPLAKVELKKSPVAPQRIQLIIRGQAADPRLDRLIEEQLLIVMYTELKAMAGHTEGILLFSRFHDYQLLRDAGHVKRGKFSGLEFDSNLLHQSLDELKKLQLGRMLPAFLAQLEAQKDLGIQDKVRNVLLRLATPYFPDLQEVASFLHKSTRSLQRELREESTSFRRVLNELKLTTARYLLLNHQLKINDIAYLLGYATSSTFIRHFKKSMDMSPREFRKQKLQK